MENKNKNIIGHIYALITIIIWGTTFISTKVLLNNFSPIEILFFRFTIGFFALFIISPHKLKLKEKKEEFLFISAGLSGVTLYFLFENIALTYSFASNVGVIIAISPFFTAILAHIFLEKEKFKLNFFIGFISAIIGIFLISFNGQTVLKLNPIGDILAVLAAFTWAVYSILIRKISNLGYNTIQSTKKIFLYGIIFMIPMLFIMDFKFNFEYFLNKINLFNILFLGLGASALCFVTWNFSVKILGAVKTSVYIYMVPVITVVASILILHENITLISVIGTVLILFGLFISESKINIKIRRDKIEHSRC